LGYLDQETVLIIPMDLSDPSVQAALWLSAFAASELIAVSRLKENSLIQLGVKLFRVLYGSRSKKVSK
jgi:hypothetical protein